MSQRAQEPTEHPSPEDVEPVAHETRDRIITGLVTIVLALGLVAWQLWAVALGWNDIFVCLTMYVGTGIGITVRRPVNRLPVRARVFGRLH